MANNRTIKIQGEMKRALSEIFFQEIKDPRMSPMATVSRVQVTPDLKYAKVYVSVYDTEEKRESTIVALTSAEAFIRSKVNAKIRMRRIPNMEFVLDDSIEYAVKMSKLIDEVIETIPDRSDEEDYTGTEEE